MHRDVVLAMHRDVVLAMYRDVVLAMYRDVVLAMSYTLSLCVAKGSTANALISACVTITITFHAHFLMCVSKDNVICSNS